MLKRTKIVATISDDRATAEFIQQLEHAGMNVVRLNSAHQEVEQAAALVDMVRSVSDRIGILVDTKGPEIRTSRLGSAVEVKVGTPIQVVGDPEGASCDGTLYVSSPKIVENVPLGASLLIDDGELELIVTGKSETALTCFPQSDGVIKNRKSVNVPNVPIDLPTLSEKDKRFLKLCAEKNVDFVAHSFVRTAQDVIDVQKELDKYGATTKIIAKIENQQGVDNIDEILAHVHGVMVARGDLGIEIPEERVPAVQRMIVKKCIETKKPVIIATQMLHSMISNPRPTRAEISDVASAIYQRSDAVMLSGETAYGKYPVEAVRTMARIAAEIEPHLEAFVGLQLKRVRNKITETLSRAAVEACVNLPVKAIVIDTLSGRTARYLSAFRGAVPIYAMCYSSAVTRQLSLSYGVEAMATEPRTSRDQFLTDSLRRLLSEEKFAPEDLIVVVGGSFGPSNGATFMEVSEAKNIMMSPMPHGDQE